MEPLASIKDQLLVRKQELEAELGVVTQMLLIVQPEPPAAERQTRRTRTPRREPQQQPGPTWGGTTPEPGEGRTRKEKPPVSPEIVEDLRRRIIERKETGVSAFAAIPGSVTAKELAEATGVRLEVVRRAAVQLEKDGVIKSQKLSYREQGLERPSGAVKVLVAA